MKRFSKVLVFILAVAVSMTACFTLVGCGGKKSDKLVVSTMFGEGDQHTGTFKLINSQFEKENGIKIEDRSGIVEDANWKDAFMQDMQSVNNVPDVIFFFNGKQVDAFRDKLVTVETIRTKYKDFAKNITVNDTDPASIEMKAGAQAIMYDNSKWASTDFASYETLLAKLVANKDVPANRPPLASDLPHYWFNHIMVQKLGIDEFAAMDGTKAYFTDAKKTLWIDAIKATIEDMRSFGYVGSTAASGTEPPLFYTGERGIEVDGQWTAAKVNASTIKDKIKFANFPKKGDKTYAIGGITNGWYITKQAWDDTAKRELAVKYVEAHSADVVINSYCLSGGGAPATGKALEGASYGAQGFASVVGGGVVVTPAIDDRVSDAAKGALLSNWSDNHKMAKLLSKAAAPTSAEVTDLFNDFFNNL